jgi:hypothetical protein
MCDLSSPSKSEQDYRAEDDHRTLSRAAEIRQDPARVAAVKAHHQTVKKRIASVGRSLSKGRR